MGRRPAGKLGAGHRVPANVAFLKTALQHEVVHRLLHADHVCNAAARGVLRDGVQDGRHRIHRYRDHDQGLLRLCLLQCGLEVVGDVETIFLRSPRARIRVRVAERIVAGRGEVANDGATDQPQPNNADGRQVARRM